MNINTKIINKLKSLTISFTAETDNDKKNHTMNKIFKTLSKLKEKELEFFIEELIEQGIYPSDFTIEDYKRTLKFSLYETVFNNIIVSLFSDTYKINLESMYTSYSLNSLIFDTNKHYDNAKVEYIFIHVNEKRNEEICVFEIIKEKRINNKTNKQLLDFAFTLIKNEMIIVYQKIFDEIKDKICIELSKEENNRELMILANVIKECKLKTSNGRFFISNNSSGTIEETTPYTKLMLNFI